MAVIHFWLLLRRNNKYSCCFIQYPFLHHECTKKDIKLLKNLFLNNEEEHALYIERMPLS